MKHTNFTSKYIIAILVVLVLALSFSVVSAQTELTITPSSIAGPPESKRTIRLVADDDVLITIGRQNDSFSRAGGTALPTAALGELDSTLTLPSTPGSYTVIATADGMTTHVDVSVTPVTLRKASGDGQFDRPGGLLDSPFVVSVFDVNGRLVIGQKVTFSVVTGEGSLSATTVRSNSSGRAETYLVLGELSGKNTVQASVAGGEPVLFTATAVAPPSVLKIHAGNNQTGIVSNPLSEPFVVQLFDTESRPIEGYTVRFNVKAGRGRLSEERVRTDSEGFAKTTFTPSSRGTLRIEATAGRVPLVSFAVTMVRPLRKMLIVSGNNQSGPPNRKLPNPLVVEVRDTSGGTPSGITVRFGVTIGGGRVSPTSATTDANGRAQTVFTLGDEIGDNTVTARVSGLTEGVTFKATTSAEVRVDASLRSPIYWINGADGTLHRVVDGVVEDLAPNITGITSFTVDSANGLLYWGVQTGANRGAIQRSRLDGRNVQTLKDRLTSVPMGIAVDSEGGRVYWTSSRGRIQSIATEGSAKITNVVQDLSNPGAVAFSNGYLYWAETTGKIRRVNLTAAQATIEEIATGLGEPLSIAIAKGKLYWVERRPDGSGRLQRVNLNDTGIQELKVFASGVPTSIAVDGSDNKIYWTKETGKIQRSNLVGKFVKDVATGLTEPVGIAVGTTEVEPIVERPIQRTSDVNRDGKVDEMDLSMVGTALFGGSPPARPGRLDVNGDGELTIADLVQVVRDLDDFDAAAPAIGVALTDLDLDRIQAQFDLLLSSGDVSLAAQRALAYLQSLLASARPSETLLLTNYPNPFNPETWIPYHLATRADVRINIYDAQGTLVRALTLGHQTAGYYTSRNRAAYWDGRNALGERVASGIYFYQLQTDEVSPMRKMVILK